MNSRYFRRCLGAATMLAAVPAAAEHNPPSTDPDAVLTDTIIVTARRAEAISADGIAPPQQIALPADAAAIAARVPGGDLFGNGALSGQLSYRGLAGERVLGRINGQRFATGGPNAMDPPLHYAPAILVDRIEVARGVAPVSSGPALAGAVNAELVQAQFSDSESLAPQLRAAAQYRSVDDSYALGGMAGLANENWRLGVIAAREEGHDYAFPGGTAVGTAFERNLYGFHAGFRTSPGELFVEYRRSETDPTGNPPFALDIVYFDTDFVQGGFRGEIADDVTLNVRIGHVAVRHLMDNQTIRQPAAPAMMARATFADADTTTAEASVRFGGDGRYLKIGGDVELTEKFVTITNPFNPVFFIESQPDARSDRYGGFVQWRGGLGAVQFEAGARIDDTRQSVGAPRLGAAVPMGPRALAAAFIAANRKDADTTLDVVLRGWAPLGAFTPRITLARKERVPSVLERFGWLPTEASFGLADGNIYVGNPALKPETAWIAEAGFDYDGDRLTIRPTLFYRRVDDFIQGVPFDATVGVIDSTVEMVANMNGDPTPLRFANTDAELYGADLDFSIRPLARVELLGTASLVRGQRRDMSDDLYRVPPVNLRLSAVWAKEKLSLGAELFAAAAQDRVSVSNGEQPSESFATLGLFARYALGEGLAVEVGVENLLDESYAPHLAGRSRVGASDVSVGERLPGAGRGGWVRVTARF
ncbi:TonB-dependent receptor [Erythrobacter sp. sf7]|uniref:TonB-dependent receptor n=1 Tax=Erythrobacter fulvus TaxID=2987523 RepID=A0ABT5JPT3_9SPHN|nr:TonB-dependent receptor [Erythrobacter fulvus]MDC8754653.1 TonB-dependent receptor [Erythrobacter fulvus]